MRSTVHITLAVSPASLVPEWASLANAPNGTLQNVSLNTVNDVWRDSPDPVGYPIGKAGQLFIPWMCCTYNADFGPFGVYTMGTGGGHGGGTSTAIYGWDPATQLFYCQNATRHPARVHALTNAVPSPASFNASYQHWDNHPDLDTGELCVQAAHSYNMMGHVAPRWAGNAKGWKLQMLKTNTGGIPGTPTIYAFDPDTGKQIVVGNYGFGANGDYGGLSVDNKNGAVYIWMSYDGLKKATLTDGGTLLPVSLNHVLNPPRHASFYYAPGEIVPEHDLFVTAIEFGGNIEVYATPLLTTPGWSLKATFSAATSGLARPFGMFWSPDTRCLYLDKGSNTFVRIEIPAVWTEAWNVSEEIATGVARTTDTYLFQKMRYAPSLKGALCCRGANQPMQFYRPAGTI